MSEKIVQLNEEVIKGQIKELVRGSVEETLNGLLEEEAQKLTQAARYERNEERQAYRSGHYQRNLTTTSGDVTLNVPRLKGVTFETAIIERYRRRENKELNTLVARDNKLDGLFERIYEDNVSSKITDERFHKMFKRYEEEQCELLGRIKALKAELEKGSNQMMTTDMFIATVRKYTRAKKLTPHVLNKLIERIEVYHAEKIDGVHVQRLTIDYACVGSIEIPNELPLPPPEVLMQTRKGVAVSYSHMQQAI